MSINTENIVKQMVVATEVLSASQNKQVTDEVHQNLTVKKFTNDKNLAHFIIVVSA